MKQKPSSPSFADLVLGQREVKQPFFSQTDKIFQLESNSCHHRSRVAYTKGHQSTGRPSYDNIVLFKTEFLRVWHGLSDDEVEEQVNDRLSFSRFARLPQGTPAYADKGYDSTENKGVLKRMKLKSRIMHKAVRERKITEREQRVNVAISKTRYKAERTFGPIRR